MKKLLTFALAFLFVCALGMGSVGCSKTEPKKEEPKKEEPAKKTGT
ncbi:MAG: hypothetical protein L0Z62_13695 [Gemmataceae bacterium]|nr:hypothetical protein [Gemmataceae bacterium]